MAVLEAESGVKMELDIAPRPGSREPLGVGLVAQAATSEQPTPRVSLVIPGINESESLGELASRIAQSLDGRLEYEILFVDDGSTDDSWKVISALH
ncbi:MAG: glycosyltransferase, partial [Byssovorax sp.]